MESHDILDKQIYPEKKDQFWRLTSHIWFQVTLQSNSNKNSMKLGQNRY